MGRLADICQKWRLAEAFEPFKVFQVQAARPAHDAEQAEQDVEGRRQVIAEVKQDTCLP